MKPLKLSKNTNVHEQQQPQITTLIFPKSSTVQVGSLAFTNISILQLLLLLNNSVSGPLDQQQQHLSPPLLLSGLHAGVVLLPQPINHALQTPRTC